MNSLAKIIRMDERIYETIPLDKITVLNPRNRDPQKFEEIVRSIAEVGLLEPIKVNRRNLAKTQRYELVFGEGRCLAYKKLGFPAIKAEVVDYDEQQAYIESLVENMARVPQGTMTYARELKRMRDEGVPLDKISVIAGKHPSYVASFIQLVERGEDRLIKGVEQNLFTISFALQVAQSDDVQVQNVLMDAFDSGLINSANMTNVRKIIEFRVNHGKRPKHNPNIMPMPDYTVRDLKKDITQITKEKEGFVRETTDKENRLFTLVLAMKTLAQDEHWLALTRQAGISEPPQLEGSYTNTAR